MRAIRSVSVLMPTWQGREFLERALEALASQRVDVPWDLTVVDSGSTDGTWECLERTAARFPVPMRLERIHKLEFDHGDTRNLLAARSSGDLLVYLTQDAIPSSSTWLARVIANFQDERVAAVTCRNVPRSDAALVTRIFSRDDPGYSTARRETRLPSAEVYARASPDERRLLYCFNDVASAVRREVWERHPFPRTDFGEDVLLARAFLEAGYTIVYDAEATVEHSHDYDERESYSRAWIDGRFNVEWLDRVCITEARDVDLLTTRLVSADASAISTCGVEPAEQAAVVRRARRLRRATIQGLYDGGRSTRRRPRTRVLASPKLSILYVVHGFPPDTWAGTEVYTLSLAREMARRGHRVTILARTPADARELPDFHVEDTSFQGLRLAHDASPRAREPARELSPAARRARLRAHPGGSRAGRGALPALDPSLGELRADGAREGDRDGRHVSRLLGALRARAARPARRSDLRDESEERLLRVRQGARHGVDRARRESEPRSGRGAPGRLRARARGEHVGTRGSRAARA
jgi:rhamnosyltransferase